MSQAELAKKSSIALRTIFNYENGRSVPRNRDIYSVLACALGVDISFLLDEEDEFILRAGELYGRRGRKQAQEVIMDIEKLFQEKDFLCEDKSAIRKGLMDAFWEAKQKNRKYVNKRYLDDAE